MAKLNNKQRVYSAVLKGGKRTRTAISNHLGLSTTAVSKSLSKLREEGALQVSGKLKGEELHYTTDKTPKHQTKRDPFAGVQPAGTPTEEEPVQQELVPANEGTGQGGYEDIPVYWIDGEPMVYDLDLAEALGYSTTRHIRELIRRLLSSGALEDSPGVCRAIRQTPEGGGRPATAFYLGEKAALKVVTKSETAQADAITDQVIEVFIQARKGQLPAQQPEQPALPSEPLEQEKKALGNLREIMTMFGVDQGHQPALAAKWLRDNGYSDLGPVLPATQYYEVPVTPSTLETRFGLEQKGQKGRRINGCLQHWGLQVKDESGKWRVTDAAYRDGIGAEFNHNYKNSDGSGFRPLWYPSRVEPYIRACFPRSLGWAKHTTTDVRG